MPGVTFQLRQPCSLLLSTASLCSYMHNYYSSPGIVSPKPRDAYDLHPILERESEPLVLLQVLSGVRSVNNRYLYDLVGVVWSMVCHPWLGTLPSAGGTSTTIWVSSVLAF